MKEYVVVKDAETGKTRLLVREVKSPVAAPAGSLRAMPVGKRFRMAGALCWLAGLKIESRDRVDNLRNLSFKLFFLFAIGIPFGGLFAGVGMASYKPEERNHFFLVASTIVLSLVAVTIVARALLRRILLKRLPQVAEPARSRPQGPYRTSLTPEPRDKP